MRKIPASVAHGTVKAMFDQLGERRESLITLYPTARPSPVPTTIEVRATKDDSIRKLACTILLLKPIARTTPICCRRSTTARAVISPLLCRARSHRRRRRPSAKSVKRPE